MTEQKVLSEWEELLEQVREALRQLDKEGDEEAKDAFGQELAAMAEGFADAESWEAARQAEEEKYAELEQKIAAYEQDIQRLEALAQELEQMKKQVVAQLFIQAGAIDGEYLAEQIGQQVRFENGQIWQPEQLVQAAREQFPGLFKKKLDGVRPAEVKEVREPVGEMSFLERVRMFQERPGEYRRVFKK